MVSKPQGILATARDCWTPKCTLHRLDSRDRVPQFRYGISASQALLQLLQVSELLSWLPSEPARSFCRTFPGDIIRSGDEIGISSENEEQVADPIQVDEGLVGQFGGARECDDAAFRSTAHHPRMV